MAHQEKKRNSLINKREREKETRAKGSLCRRYTDGMIDGQTDGSSSSIRRARAARLRVADDPPLERRADECRYEGGRFPPSERVGRQHQIGRREKKATRDSWAVRKKEKEMAGQKKRKKKEKKAENNNKVATPPQWNAVIGRRLSDDESDGPRRMDRELQQGVALVIQPSLRQPSSALLSLSLIHSFPNLWNLNQLMDTKSERIDFLSPAPVDPCRPYKIYSKQGKRQVDLTSKKDKKLKESKQKEKQGKWINHLRRRMMTEMRDRETRALTGEASARWAKRGEREREERGVHINRPVALILRRRRKREEGAARREESRVIPLLAVGAPSLLFSFLFFYILYIFHIYSSPPLPSFLLFISFRPYALLLLLLLHLLHFSPSKNPSQQRER